MQNGPHRWLIGFPGRPGAFSERAAKKTLAELVEAAWHVSPYCAGRTFVEAWEWATLGARRIVVLPLWNSTAGPVRQTWECVAADVNRALWLAGTLECRVQHALLGTEGAALDAIERVRSHPQALAQCGDFIAAHQWKVEPSENTAVAAEEVAKEADRGLAAIAHRDVAGALGLSVLADEIQDAKDNRTTFGVFVSPTRNRHVESLNANAPVVIIGRQTLPKWQSFLAENGVAEAHRVDIGALEAVRTSSKAAGAAIADALRGDVVGTYEPFSCASVSAFS